MDQFSIKKITPRQVFDSRANPTVEVEIELENGIVGVGIVPSGASTGKFEALELRDGDVSKLNGKSVYKAINNINDTIAPCLTGKNVFDQSGIDKLLIELDGTDNKSNLGANALLGVSIAAAWAGANAMQLPLYRYLGGSTAGLIPLPMIQIIGGGAHAGHAVDLQDFLIIPTGSKSFEEAIEMAANVYHATKRVFTRHGKPLSIADEGGFWPTDFKNNEEGLQLVMQAITEAGYIPGKEIGIALDVAASEFYDENTGLYHLKLDSQKFTRQNFVDYLSYLVDKYPIISVEDGMSEVDWEGNLLLSNRLKDKIQLIGDDLFTTSIERIKRGATLGINNSVLINMNQIGTISETLEAIGFTKNAGYLPVISARSGETEDTTIVHLAIATNAGQLKVGSMARSERTAKWNEGIRIAQRLGTNGKYIGAEIFSRLFTNSSSG
jgi:enolase